MKNALIVGASGGIGTAMTHLLRAQNWIVETRSRREDGLDICDEESVRRSLSDTRGDFDLIFVATGALSISGDSPEKALSQISGAAMQRQFMLNCVGPSLVLKHSVRLLARDRPAVFAALSARVGSIGDNRLGGWYAYRSAKAALNQMVHTAAIEIARKNRQAICVALHPGTVQTPLTAGYTDRHASVEPERAAQNLLGVIEGLTPRDTGQFFDWQGKPVPW